MIKDKEYPATHSMSTSWFGIDKEGNVAIIDYNENGPVPDGLDETCAEDIIESDFPIKIDSVLYEIPLTDYQAEEVIQYLDYTSLDADIDFENIVKINTDYTTEFLSKVTKYTNTDGSKRKVIRLSERLGLYLCDFYGVHKNTIKSLIRKRIIQRHHFFLWDNVENFDDKRDEWVLATEPGSCLLPIYYYVQPYSPHQLIEKVREPENPLTVEQINPAIRNRALRFPFSFKTQRKFQILEFYAANSNLEDISTDMFEKHEVTLSDGTKAIIATSYLPSIDCAKCNLCDLHLKKYIPWAFHSDKPTGIIISGLMQTNDWLNVMGSSYGSCMYCEMCPHMVEMCTGLTYNERVILTIEEKGKDWFSIIADNIIDAAETLKPYCLLIESRLMPIMKDLFRVDDGWIMLGTQNIRIFESDNIAENKSEIDSLLSQPYRGCVFERIQRLKDK